MIAVSNQFALLLASPTPLPRHVYSLQTEQLPDYSTQPLEAETLYWHGETRRRARSALGQQ